jgi:hypothetical protein
MEAEKPLWGAKAIGEVLGISERRTYYLLEQGLIPGKKIGRTWTATPGNLRELFDLDRPNEKAA